MEDLSGLFSDPISALVPTAQSGGNQVSSLANAMTAPGSQPSTPFTSMPGEVIDHPAPDVDATRHDRRTVTGGGDSGLRGGRPALVRGGWNDMGGGPAPEGYRDA